MLYVFEFLVIINFILRSSWFGISCLF